MLAVFVSCVLATPIVWAQTSETKDDPALATALKGAKVSLERGLTASAKEGTPMKGAQFSEVIVDHTTGKVAKKEAITHGDDLTHAKAQREAMAKARRSLSAAASEAVKENKGYRVVSVMPALKDGHPVADVTLVKGTEWKTVSEELD